MLQDYLDEQQRLTAVERFTAAQECGVLSEAEAKPKFRDLIPADRPARGEQYAFEVDLDRCTGCKACVTGCHSRNGLDEGETWRQVGTIELWGKDGPAPQTVTSACHHCVDPACLSGCPVLAYEKEPDTGVVRHLDDQCIGCQYCIMKCPYEVPQYDKSRGIVRKCDMCVSRLSAGEAPACVQSCPTEAIRIAVVDKEQAAVAAQENFSPITGAPEASYTRPTTIYKTIRASGPPTRVMGPGVAPQHPHVALVFMLVLTQASVGVLLGGRIFTTLAEGSAPASAAGDSATAASAAFLALLGLAAATLHLGRPRYAFRAVLGWKTSWLSREALAFGLYGPLVLAYAGIAMIAARDSGGAWAAGLWLQPAELADGSAWAATAVGLLAILCSSMVYVDTPRPAWASRRTVAKFILTVVVVALLALVMEAAVAGESGVAGRACVAGIVALGFKLYVELGVVCRPSSAGLMIGVFRPVTVGRVILALAGAGVSVSASIELAGGNEEAALAQVGLAFVFLLAGELAERFLFFASVSTARMPGA